MQLVAQDNHAVSSSGQLVNSSGQLQLVAQLVAQDNQLANL